jgi:hypothetical protein
MKKLICSIASLFLLNNLNSQVIFSENFDGSTNLPSGWTQSNVDGLTVASNLATLNFGNNAWIVRSNAVTETGNHAISTSWYTPAASADDWLISPQVSIPATGNYLLQFEAMAPDATYLDGFKVYVSTSGNSVANFGSTAALTVNAATNTYTGYTVNLSAYAGQNIHFAIRNNSNDKFLLYVDNVVIRQPSDNNAILLSSRLNRYSLVNTNNTLSLSVKNDGGNPITSLTVNWNDGTDHISNITTNIASGATATVNHPVAVNYSTVLEKTISVNITSVNGGTDPDVSNNSSARKISTMNTTVAKKVLFEEGTGTWCGWCPRGTVAMEYMDQNHSDFVGVAVHNGDPMAVTEYDNRMGDFISGYPGSTVDRELSDVDVDKTTWETTFNQRKNLLTPALIEGSSSMSGSSITVNAKATFFTPLSEQLRLALIVVEDSVKGTTSGYNQTNYYSGGNDLIDIHGVNWKNLPDPVPASQMVYNHVGRALVGGFDGQANSVPATINEGTIAEYTFNYTVPTNSNVNNMYGVIILIDNATGFVLNSTKVKLATYASLNTQSITNFEVFPNPTTEFINVNFEAKNADYEVTIFDVNGKIVKSEKINNLIGSTSYRVSLEDLKSGNYLITLATKGESSTQHFIIK